MRVKYLHSDIETVERMKILRDLRQGAFDVLIGINLLREGLDLPEVSLIAILDADKEGFLRSATSLIQIIGRAARNINGQVIMYADKVTESMHRAVAETNRRRAIQQAFNEANDITPVSVRKDVRDVIDTVVDAAAEAGLTEQCGRRSPGQPPRPPEPAGTGQDGRPPGKGHEGSRPQAGLRRSRPPARPDRPDPRQADLTAIQSRQAVPRRELPVPQRTAGSDYGIIEPDVKPSILAGST